MHETRAPSGSRRQALLLGATMCTLLGLLLWSALHIDSPQFRDKAMHIRLVCSPIAAAIVPLAWWLADRRSQVRLPFPLLPALLVGLSLVIDLAGNATRLYVQVEDFDDAVHVVNPMLLVAALAVLLGRTGVPQWTVYIMAFGLGCAGNIVWELTEYVLMQGVGAVGLRLSLRDTLSDQAWGLLGASAGAALPSLMASRATEQPSVATPLQADDRSTSRAQPTLVSTT